MNVFLVRSWSHALVSESAASVTFLWSKGASQTLHPSSKYTVPGADGGEGHAKINTDSTKYKTNTSRYRSTNTLDGEEGRSQQPEEQAVEEVGLGAELEKVAGATEPQP